ncbi:MAG: Gmad2 immunoglobulin-like domain-containing protein [Syntrophomonadaceae bacterium]|nr:GerMN domain-containing protein [Syntrophomonadaceae bacterium]MDH7497802.1 Gmad2 immunoglobulin-like domain-containing protein [Syntrophomonadaceae bacterium]
MKTRPGMAWLLTSLLLTALLATAGCAGRQEPRPPDGEKPPPQTAAVAVYYVKMTQTNAYLVREVHQVPAEGDLRLAALQELISGQPQDEKAGRVLPEDTRILGLTVEEGLATVNFSAEVLNANVGASGEALGIQSIVNTLTEFPGIDRVAFQVEGAVDERTRDWWGHVGLYDQPFRRNLDEVWEPAIWVTSPAPGAKVASPLTVTGSARVFEATVNLRLRDAEGREVVETFTTATAGAPSRGDFTAQLEFALPATETGTLEVFWYSPEDGSEQDVVQVPVSF